MLPLDVEDGDTAYDVVSNNFESEAQLLRLQQFVGEYIEHGAPYSMCLKAEDILLSQYLLKAMEFKQFSPEEVDEAIWRALSIFDEF